LNFSIGATSFTCTSNIWALKCPKGCPDECKYDIDSTSFKCGTCTTGFYSSNDECLTDCGNGSVSGDEKCDDANSDNSDGCSD